MFASAQINENIKRLHALHNSASTRWWIGLVRIIMIHWNEAIAVQFWLKLRLTQLQCRNRVTRFDLLELLDLSSSSIWGFTCVHLNVARQISTHEAGMDQVASQRTIDLRDKKFDATLIATKKEPLITYVRVRMQNHGASTTLVSEKWIMYTPG